MVFSRPCLSYACTANTCLLALYCVHKALLELRSLGSQSRKSATAFSPIVRIGTSPHSLIPRRVCPPFGSGGDTLNCGRGGGGPNSDKGTDTLHGTLGIFALCAWDLFKRVLCGTVRRGFHNFSKMQKPNPESLTVG